MPRLIQSADKDKIPEGAKLVTQEKVAKFYSNVVEKWQPKSDIWALAYGPVIMSGIAGLSGFHVNWYFRKALSLRNFGFFSTYLPNTIIPVLVTSVHQSMMQEKIYTNLEPTTRHLELRSAIGQVIGGLIQPLVFVPFSVFMFATRHFTTRIPSPTYERKKFFRYWARLYLPFKRQMIVNAGLQAIAAAIVVKMQDIQFQRLAESIVE